MNRYCIEVDRIEPNGDIFTLVEYRKLKATKTNKGLERQLNNLVNRIGEELKYYQVPHKRYTVSVVWSWTYYKCLKVGRKLSLLRWKSLVVWVLLESTFVVLIVEQSLAFIIYPGVLALVKVVLEWLTSITILLKQSNLIMQFQVTSIEFDCSLDCEDDWSYSDQVCTEEKLNQEYVTTIWEADNEDDLIEEITTATGWCIKSIDYRHILK